MCKIWVSGWNLFSLVENVMAQPRLVHATQLCMTLISYVHVYVFLFPLKTLYSCCVLTTVPDHTIALLQWSNKVTFIRCFFQKCFRINISMVPLPGDKLSQSDCASCFPKFLFSSRFSTLQSTVTSIGGENHIQVAAFSFLAN